MVAGNRRANLLRTPFFVFVSGKSDYALYQSPKGTLAFLHIPKTQELLSASNSLIPRFQPSAGKSRREAAIRPPVFGSGDVTIRSTSGTSEATTTYTGRRGAVAGARKVLTIYLIRSENPRGTCSPEFHGNKFKPNISLSVILFALTFYQESTKAKAMDSHSDSVPFDRSFPVIPIT